MVRAWGRNPCKGAGIDNAAQHFGTIGNVLLFDGFTVVELDVGCVSVLGPHEVPTAHDRRLRDEHSKQRHDRTPELDRMVISRAHELFGRGTVAE